jgi:hypothetical protein
MKKLLPVAVIAAAAIAVPAFAAKPANPGSQATTHTNANHCKHSTLTKAYVFGGTLTGNPTVTQTAGQATPTTSDNLYDVTATFTVTHANKYAKSLKGTTFSTPITGVAVTFGQNADNTQRTPQNGDHVNIKARRAFKVKHNCLANANAPVGSASYKHVSFGGQPTP